MSDIAPHGFNPIISTPHAPQMVLSNAPGDRITVLLQRVSSATPQRSQPINLMVAPNPGVICTNGNTIYVDPNFAQLFSDEELMAVLAHEIAHGDLGHYGRAQAAGGLAGLLVGVLMRNPGLGTTLAKQATSSFVAAQFSQEQELEADCQGAVYLNALYYQGIRVGIRNDEGTTRMINALSKLQGMDHQQWGPFFSSHPAIPDRIASLGKFQQGLDAKIEQIGQAFSSHQQSSESIQVPPPQQPSNGSAPNLPPGVGANRQGGLFSGGDSLQRRLGLIPPSGQAAQTESTPPIILCAEGEIASFRNLPDGSTEVNIKNESGISTAVVARRDTTVFLDREDATFRNYTFKTGQHGKADYWYDREANQNRADFLTITSEQKDVGLSDNPTRVQCPVGKEFYNADVKICPIHKVELRRWRQK